MTPDETPVVEKIKHFETPNYKQLCQLLGGHEKKPRGSLWPSEGAHLAWLASQIPSGGAIVDVGSHRGKSVCFMASGLRHSGKTGKVYAIDLWMMGGPETSRYAHYYSENTFEVFKAQVINTGSEGIVIPIMGDSRKIAESWLKDGRPMVDLLFLDGDHRWEGISADYYAWEPLLNVGGFIAFHDYTLKFPGVQRVIDELVIDNGRFSDYHSAGRVWSARKES